ncbi:MAG: hypothetical protein ACYTEQ_16645 [Planctomycetota bacterium]|jgi:uracil-DNA glycosylase
MNTVGTFPFGQPVRVLVQQDRAPKRAFVLGVYASAVHARWIGEDGKERVKSLAVASEPEIFWRGDGAQEIVQDIPLPEGLGKLAAAERRFNGPSGIALDELILAPLGLTRADAWLCDLVPHSCTNAQQQRAIERAYLPLVQEGRLPPVSVPPVPTRWTDEPRRQAILQEILDSEARVLILLGDVPIRWFLSFHDRRRKRLATFGADPRSYGRLHRLNLPGLEIHVLPLAHPRQAARLGRSSASWYDVHRSWRDSVAPGLLGEL